MRTAVFFLLSSLTATGAFAGAYLESTDSQPGTKDAGRVTRMWFDGGRMRTENGSSGEGSVAIFKNKSMYVLNPANKTYRVIDKASLDQMAAKIAAVRKQMEATMTPERRAQMDKLMGKDAAS